MMTGWANNMQKDLEDIPETLNLKPSAQGPVPLHPEQPQNPSQA